MLSHWALEVGRGLQTWLGLQPDPTQSLPLLCLIRGQTLGDTYSPLEYIETKTLKFMNVLLGVASEIKLSNMKLT